MKRFVQKAMIMQTASQSGGAKVVLQNKTVTPSENIQEVTADSDYTALEKVTVNAIPSEYIVPSGTLEITENGEKDIANYANVNVNVSTSGGGDNYDWVVGDGKTRLHISIPTDYRTDAILYINQTVANGVSVNWGDGSDIVTSGTKGDTNFTHHYASKGDYVIELDVAEDCNLYLGGYSNNPNVVGGTDTPTQMYSWRLRKVEIGNRVFGIYNYAFDYCYGLSDVSISEGINSIGNSAFTSCYALSSINIPDGTTSIGTFAFNSCYNLSSVDIPKSVTSIGINAFGNCYTLSNVNIAEGITSIGNNVFSNCESLTNIHIPKSVTSIGSYTFNTCRHMKYYDFTKHTTVPTISAANTFNAIPSDCEIRVPAALVDEWKAATNWSTYASQIVGV